MELNFTSEAPQQKNLIRKIGKVAKKVLPVAQRVLPVAATIVPALRPVATIVGAIPARK
jgi:hypothetical protein